jgi:hypothetical protein
LIYLEIPRKSSQNIRISRNQYGECSEFPKISEFFEISTFFKISDWVQISGLKSNPILCEFFEISDFSTTAKLLFLDPLLEISSFQISNYPLTPVAGDTWNCFAKRKHIGFPHCLCSRSRRAPLSLSSFLYSSLSLRAVAG